MKFEDGHIVMDDGQKYYCHADIIGLGPSLGLTYGYDGTLTDWDHDEDYGHIKPEHRKEIAAHMIAQWTRVLNGEPEAER